MRLLSLVAVLAVPAFAQTIYSWEDADGVHYTDDLSQVPKKAKVEAVEARRGTPKPAAPGPAARVTSAPADKASEYEWRDRFIAAHRRIETVRKSLAALLATVPPRTECVPQPAPPPVGTAAPVDSNRPQPVYCQVNPLHDQLKVQIAQQTIELRNAELDLDQLDRRASMESVPREWRRGW